MLQIDSRDSLGWDYKYKSWNSCVHGISATTFLFSYDSFQPEFAIGEMEVMGTDQLNRIQTL